jgi:pre ATP-grasp domain-containing protein/carbamoyl-phosphate synthase L subunit-like protein
MDDFTIRLKNALTGSVDKAFVYAGNFEVEEQWARGERALPRVTAASGRAVVNHMDEFAMLLAGKGDHVLLKTAPDPAYLAYLDSLGLELPNIHVVATQDPRRSVTEDVLIDPALLMTLSGLATEGCQLVVHGVSELEEELAARTGLPLAAPRSAICKAVNSKVYSRKAADGLGLRQPKGWACSTVDELDAAVTGAVEVLATGRKVVVKEAFGVSGKGIAVVDTERRLRRLQRIISSGATDGRIAFVIETWVTKVADLNYQFTIGRDGGVHFDFVKEAITAGGVHKGHRIPARLTAAHVDEVRAVSHVLGQRLAADGYFGVVGVDAMVDPDGGLYPVVEINARNNMSTYQVSLQEKFVRPGKLALARYYSLRLRVPLSFDKVRRLLAGLIVEHVGGNGLLVNNFATVNAAAGPTEFDGRLYGLVVADGEDELAAIDESITAALEAL